MSRPQELMGAHAGCYWPGAFGGLTRPDAEAGALQDAIAHWLARDPLSPGVPEDGCMHCAGALPVDYRVAVLAGAGHAWLHPTCMQEMKEARLALAGSEVRGLLGFSEAILTDN